MAENGWIYGILIDPLLKNMRKRVTGEIKNGDTLIDIACGTGAQIFSLSHKASKAVGVDLSESMIKRAETYKSKKKPPNTEFYVSDATNLNNFSDGEFGVALMSLALHQFSPELYREILAEMKRISQKQIIVDYAVPLPENYAGYGSKIAEFLAGREHHANFKKFCKLGGLDKILPDHSLQIIKKNTLGKGAFQLVICK